MAQFDEMKTKATKVARASRRGTRGGIFDVVIALLQAPEREYPGGDWQRYVTGSDTSEETRRKMMH